MHPVTPLATQILAASAALLAALVGCSSDRRHEPERGPVDDVCESALDCEPGMGCEDGTCVPESTEVLPEACLGVDPAASAAQLAARSRAWQEEYHCALSCHTTVPFLLATPLLGAEVQPTAAALLAEVEGRALDWASAAPWYGEAYGPGKANESRSTEAVLNALVLLRRDAQDGAASDSGRAALEAMWAAQTAGGDFAWLDFGLLPWEDDSARPMGMAFAALAAASVPGDYLITADGADAERIALLREALRGALSRGVALDRVFVAWAASEWPGLLSEEEREALVSDLVALQRADGGWNLAELGEWRAQPSYPTETSTAYATAITTYVLVLSGLSARDPAIARACGWLVEHRSGAGEWADVSLNRDESFNHTLVTDAATAFALLALAAADGT